MSDSLKKQFYTSLVLFLKSEIDSDYSSDTIESLEVAKQCLETAFGVVGDEKGSAELLNIYQRGLNSSTADSKNVPQPTENDKAMAANLKLQGNVCMTSDNFEEAVACYTKAIELDPQNAVYYCNRAAAYGRMNKHDEAVKDCEEAIRINPSYSKAYGRMGMAYSGKGNHQKAIDCYHQAMSLDPENQNFVQNLSIAEEHLRSGNSSSQQPPSVPGGLPFGNLGSFLANPGLQACVSQMLSSPDIQNTISGLMGNIAGQQPAATPQDGTGAAPDNTAPPGNLPNMTDLLRIGQQLAQQMQQGNPNLVEQLRQEFQSQGQPPNTQDNPNDQAPNS